MQTFNKSHLVDDSYSTSFKGVYLNAPTRKLYELLRNESIDGSGDDKVRLTWIFTKAEDEMNKQQVITIYDYKSEKLLTDVTHWHVGGKRVNKEIIKTFLLSKGFDEKEIKFEDHPHYK